MLLSALTQANHPSSNSQYARNLLPTRDFPEIDDDTAFADFLLSFSALICGWTDGGQCSLRLRPILMFAHQTHHPESLGVCQTGGLAGFRCPIAHPLPVTDLHLTGVAA